MISALLVQLFSTLYQSSYVHVFGSELQSRLISMIKKKIIDLVFEIEPTRGPGIKHDHWLYPATLHLLQKNTLALHVGHTFSV